MSRVASGEVCGLVEQAVTYGEGEGEAVLAPSHPCTLLHLITTP